MPIGDNRIKYALYLKGWDFLTGNKDNLRVNSNKVLPPDYTIDMKGHIFCPVCSTNLSRAPQEKQNFKNTRNACYRHLPSFKHVDCDLRTPKPEGMRYVSEELAKQAIANDKLAIIHGFRKEAPADEYEKAEEYDQSAVENEAGPITRVPIARHKDDTFELPSLISTIAGICRKFDDNLYKYYVFPGAIHARLLTASLVDLRTVERVDPVPKLYFGIVIGSFFPFGNKSPNYIRFTELECNPRVKDFNLKAIDKEQARKGITEEIDRGRIVLFWGIITESGIGLCVEKLGWGEYDLLPEKYNTLLE